MIRTLGVGVVVAGLAGCASTARPMLFSRNNPQPTPYTVDPGMVITEGPMLPQGVPIASMPGPSAPMMYAQPGGMVTQPGGMVMPPAMATPTPMPAAPPPPMGPQPRTTPPGSGTNTG